MPKKKQSVKSETGESKLTGQKLLNAIASDIRAAAQDADIEPGLLTLPKYYEHGGYFKEWQLRKVGGYNAVKKLFFDKDLPKDRATVGEVKELRKKYLSTERELETREMFIERLEASLKLIKPIKMVPFRAKDAYHPVKRVVSLLLSDLHFGSDIEESEVGHTWGKVEEARCFAKIVKNVCSYKTHYRKDTRLVVNIIGDVIENELHDKSTAAPLHEQACRAIHLLSQGIGRFSENYPEVVVNFAVGNHGRDMSIHHGRATSMKWNALETTIYFAVKKACEKLGNVKFHQPLTPWVTYEALGHKVYVAHGDTNINVGNPGSSISVKQIEMLVNRLNSSLKDEEKFAVVAIGHVHIATSIHLPNGTYLFTNGPLVPTNSYAQTFGNMNCPQDQIMWETTEKFAVGDQRFINAAGAEKDSSLDKIIKPFEGVDV
jgi:hypothetical protein